MQELEHSSTVIFTLSGPRSNALADTARNHAATRTRNHIQIRTHLVARRVAPTLESVEAGYSEKLAEGASAAAKYKRTLS